jgi:hypothetical protein
MFTVRNTVRVAIMQVGVLVAGILASGLCHRLAAVNGISLSWPPVLLYNYGILGLAIPLIWTALALILHRRSEISDELKALVFLSGILLLVAFAAFVLYADVSPWFHFMWRQPVGDEGG